LGLPANQQLIAKAKSYLSTGLASGSFTAKIDRVFYGLGSYAAAHQYFESQDHVGKVVVSLA